MGPDCNGDILRKVRVDDYVLLTWDTNGVDNLGKYILGYRFSKGEGENDVIFEGEDFHCSPCEAIDSDASLRAILGFLTLRPGDTDSEYFDNYTPRQWEFVNSDAETISLYGLEDTDDGPLPEFIDIDDASINTREKTCLCAHHKDDHNSSGKCLGADCDCLKFVPWRV